MSSNSGKLSNRETGGLVLIVGLFLVGVFIAGKIDDNANKRDCLLEYATSDCLKQRLKEAELKETYETNLKGLKNE